MSTKIYGGLILDFNNSFYDLKNKLIKFAKNDLTKLATQEYINVFTRLLTQKIDLDTYSNKDDESYQHKNISKYLSEVHYDILDRIREIEKTGYRDPEVDFKFDLVIFPLKNKVLAITYCEKSSMSELLKSLPYVKDYSYWNNTDRPKELTSKEWSTRKKDWDTAIVTGIPAESGFTISLLPSRFQPIVSISDIVNYLPTFEERAHHIVEGQIWKEIHKTLTEEENKALENGQFSIYMKKTREFAMSEVGIKRKEELTKEVIEVISKYDFNKVD